MTLSLRHLQHFDELSIFLSRFMAHWDTSGLLKLFLAEPDSSTFAALAAA
jgi:hypothetical protein